MRYGRYAWGNSGGGSSYYWIDVVHPGLGRTRRVKAQTEAEVDAKAAELCAKWDAVWHRRLEREAKTKQLERKRHAIDGVRKRAAKLSREATEAIRQCETILVGGIDAKGLAIDWESMMSKAKYKEARSPKPEKSALPQEPKLSDKDFVPKLGVFGRFLHTHREQAQRDAKALFERRYTEWLANCEIIRKRDQIATEEYSLAMAAWNNRRDAHLETQRKANLSVDAARARYESGEKQAVIDYYDHVLTRSAYPSFIPREWTIAFVETTKVLVVDLKLPERSKMPNAKEAKYSGAKAAVVEVQHKESTIDALYDSVIYQICLRTIHEIYSTDAGGHISAVVLNGWVEFANPATGHQTTACIASVQAKREELQAIDFSNVDPKACFRALKGISSSKLHSMVAIRPILQINKEDRRFVESVNIASDLANGTNIAAIGWQDFEHLIREVFEREFSTGGGEVKVTQASRDGGVDAIAFDPDPIRGGKIVIQAKRYTNTVDVSAVRDLYGTVMNEGATKGILVTTSSFGPDAYQFAKDKPLTLLDGGNLLYLLEKHGHRVRIDLAEAKSLGLSMQR